MQVRLTPLMGGRLKSARINAGLTRKDVAERLKISVSAISYWERGITIPTLENMVELKKMYNKSIDWLIGLEKPKTIYNFTYPSIQY